MPLEQQVCSLELAQRLKELGVKQESLFIWVDGKSPYVRDSDMRGCRRCGAILNGIMPPRSVPTYAAFTVAELGDSLKDYIGVMPAFNSNSDGGWYYRAADLTVHERTEADARAAVRVYLLENKLITS